MASDDDEWETGDGEQAADPYNRTAFAGAAPPPSDGPSDAAGAAEEPAPAAADAGAADGLGVAAEGADGAALAAAQEAADAPAAAPGVTEAVLEAAADPVTVAQLEPSSPPRAPEAFAEALVEEMTALSVESPAASPGPTGASSPLRVEHSGGATSPATRKLSAPSDAPDFLREAHTGDAFTEKLDPEALKFFNEVCEKPFHDQAIAFLNAYWQEVSTQAEFIFSVAWETMKYADMHSKGVNYIHLYEEGNDLDFNIGLYFYEKLCKKVLDDDDGKKWRDDPAFKPSMPEMLTAIKRKIELREKVDCNFDGRVSFLEYLLYQYRDFANPADFTFRAMKTADVEEHPEILKARKALEEVNKAIQAYEAEKHRLETEADKPGVKGLGAKHQLAILGASPLAEQLNKSLITAEAAVRIATRKFGDGRAPAPATETEYRKPTEGSMWWMNRDLEQKKKLYGRRK